VRYLVSVAVTMAGVVVLIGRLVDHRRFGCVGCKPSVRPPWRATDFAFAAG
jgi:hypothetical protein